jgi:hypothetical protein
MDQLISADVCEEAKQRLEILMAEVTRPGVVLDKGSQPPSMSLEDLSGSGGGMVDVGSLAQFKPDGKLTRNEYACGCAVLNNMTPTDCTSLYTQLAGGKDAVDFAVAAAKTPSQEFEELGSKTGPEVWQIEEFRKNLERIGLEFNENLMGI